MSALRSHSGTGKTVQRQFFVRNGGSSVAKKSVRRLFGAPAKRNWGSASFLVCHFFLERRLFPVTTRTTWFKKRTTKSLATVKPDKLKTRL